MGPVKPIPGGFGRWFFALTTLFVLYLSWVLIRPFLIPVFLAVVLTLAGRPVYEFLLKYIPRPAIASALTCLVLVGIIVVPFILVAGMLTTQAMELYVSIGKQMKAGMLEQTIYEGLGRLGPVLKELKNYLGLSRADVLKELGELLRRISEFIYSSLGGIIRGLGSMVGGFVLMMFVTYYLLVDGHRLVERVCELSPMPYEVNLQIREVLASSLKSTLRGSVLLALIHGALGGIGMWIFGVPHALFWATVMVFASVVPVVGTALVWVPAGAYMIMVGELGAGIGMMIWCLMAAIVGDNFLRPRLIGSGTGLHPLLTFFAILGGIASFGLVGLLVGPMVLALLLALLEIYQGSFLVAGEEDGDIH